MTKLFFKQPKRVDRFKDISKTRRYTTSEKFDGSRTMFVDEGNKGKFINRRYVNKTRQYPEFSNFAKRFPSQNIIDGEVVAFNKKGNDDFQLLSQREHLKNPKEINEKAKQIPLTFLAFDLLKYHGKDIKNLPFEERQRLLKKLNYEAHLPSSRFKVIPHKIEGKNYMHSKQLLRNKQTEGVVLKDVKSSYTKTINDDWLKMKQHNEADMVITGFTEGSEKNKVGAIFVGVQRKQDGYGIKEISKVGLGYNPKEARRLYGELNKIRTYKEDGKINVKPIRFAAVTYLKRGSKGALREPVYKGERTDITLSNTHL